VLVIAAGSVPGIPDIPGVDKPNVATAIDMLLDKVAPGNKTIVAGGGGIGCELALHLVKQGKKVTVVEMLPQLAADMPAVGSKLVAELADNGVETLTNLEIKEITGSGITGTDKDGNTVTVEGDKVVLAMGMTSRNSLYDEVKDKVPEVYLIGDSLVPRRVAEATREGYRIGSTI
jgi:2-enoate reductase